MKFNAKIDIWINENQKKKNFKKERTPPPKRQRMKRLTLANNTNNDKTIYWRPYIFTYQYNFMYIYRRNKFIIAL